MSHLVDLALESSAEHAGTIVSVGHVFKQGDIAEGQTLVASIGDDDVPLQVDVKATWPDGSIKHAVLSFASPDADATLSLSVGDAGDPAPAESVAALAAAQNYDFEVEIADEVVQVADLLAAQEGEDGAAWLSGALVNQTRVTHTTENGLELRIDVTARADGSIETSVTVGNDNIDTVDLETKVYAYALRQNGVTVLADEALEQPHHTVWRESFSTASADGAHVVYDLAYLRATGMLPLVDEALPLIDSQDYADRYADPNATYDPLELGGVDNVGGIDEDRGRTGSTPSYGLITDDQHSYLVSQTREAREGMLALTDQYGAFSNSYRNPETGEAYFIEDTDFNSSTTGVGKDVGGTGGIVDLNNDGLALRNSYSHKPSEYYLSYLVTGDRYYADGLAGEAGSALLLWANGAYLTERGAIDFGSQLREQTVVLRDLYYAQSVAPDGSHAATVLQARLDGALEDYLDYFVRREGPLTSQLGSELTGPLTGPHFVGGDLEGALQNYGGTAVDRPYWQDWFGMVIGQIAATGDERAIELGRWMAGFSAERFLQDDFDPRHNLFSIVNYPVGSSLDLAPDASWADLNAAAEAAGATDTLLWSQGGFYAASAWGGTAAMLSGTGDARYAEALLWMSEAITDRYVEEYMLQGLTAQFSVPVVFGDQSTAGVTDRTIGTDLADDIADGDGARIIHAGQGDDTVTTGAGSHLVEGGDGNDAITAGAGEDWLFGGSGEDTLAGGAGVNYLQGDRHDEDFGRFADTFAFSEAIGETVIGDFTPGQDRLTFDAIGGFKTGAAIIDAFVQVGEDAVLDLGDTGSLTLRGVAVADLLADDITLTNIINSIPEAQDDGGLSVGRGETLLIDAAQLLANDADPDGDSLGLLAIDAVEGGTVTVVDGAISFVADAGFAGTGGFDYVVSDGFGGEASARVSIEVLPYTPLSVTIAGDAQEDAALTAVIDPGEEDISAGVTYQWLHDGQEIPGATASTYTPGQGDIGTTISVSVRHTDGAGLVRTTRSAPSDPIENTNDAPDGGLTIAGQEVAGGELSVWSTLSDEDGLGDVDYLWHRDGVAMDYATAETYALTRDDVGSSITVSATYTDGFGTLETVVAEATGTIADDRPVSDPPIIPETTNTLFAAGWLTGTEQNDMISPTGSNVVVLGEGGDDVLNLHGQAIQAMGGDGDDLIYVHGNDQVVQGNEGADSFVISGPLFGVDIRDFQADEDTLYFANGIGGIVRLSDVVASAVQDGDDVIIATAAGSVTLRDTALDSLSAENVRFFRDEVERPDLLTVPHTVETLSQPGWIYGGADSETIVSAGGNILLSGGFGDDHLIAEHWGVRMQGGAGDDLLESRDSYGLLFGGAGMDQFYFVTHANGIVGDFQSGIDRVVLGTDTGFASAAQAHGALRQTDDGAVLDSASGQILFAGLDVDQIGQSDFLSDGAGRRVLVEDTADDRGWQSYINTFDGNGVRTNYDVIYDNGNVLDRTYSDGIIATSVLTETSGTVRTTTYDEAGIRTNYDIAYSNGNVLNRTYVDGVTATNALTEADGDVRITTYDADGMRTHYEVMYANGSALDRTYTDGIIATSALTEADGDLRTTTYDGEGNRESFVFQDISDARNWQSYTNTYDETGARTNYDVAYDNGNTLARTYVEGTIALSILTQADGDVRTTVYDANGNRESLTFEDISDSRNWQSYTNTYDEAGELLSKEYIWDAV